MARRSHKIFVFVLLVLNCIWYLSCSESTESPEAKPREKHFVIALVDEQYDLAYEGDMILRILKFTAGDQIVFTSGEQSESTIRIPVTCKKVTQTEIILSIPREITSGRWSIWCQRGEEFQYLGTTTLHVDIFRLVHNVNLDAQYEVDKGDLLTIYGEGFASTDQIRFISMGQKEYDAETICFDERSLTVQLPLSLESGIWELWLKRGVEEQPLGKTEFRVSTFDRIDVSTLPEGTNLYGRVYCGDKALENVVVSDGLQVVKTDARGVWSMISDLESDLVFVSLPQGYESNTEEAIPQFYHLFEQGRRRYDFSLAKCDNHAYVLMAVADIQIDNNSRLMVPQSSLMSCQQRFIPDFQKTLNELGAKKIYAISLGDMLFDKHIYQHQFGFDEYRTMISSFGIPFFHVIGNHDYDPYITGDHATKSTFRQHLGPTYYSINLGEIHCIALDNFRIDNNGAAEGIFGNGFYETELSERQLQWLKADLATIEDKTTPLMIWMHAPLTACRQLTPALNPAFENAQELVDCIRDFTNVLILSGHWHNNHTGICPGYSQIQEHNLGAVSGALWYNVKGFNGSLEYGAGTDGSPMGYGIYEIDGRKIRWRYKACDLDKNRVFTAYDMNKLDPTWKDKNIPNEILVNVWGGWDSQWKVEIFEDSLPLTVKQEMRKDPNYLQYVKRVYIPSGDDLSKSAANAQSTPHMFSAVTNNETSAVSIQVTDRFGEIYTQQLRP